MIALEDARARAIPLPADDLVAQDIIDETEAWLARRIGLLEGERTETFFVGGLTVGAFPSIGKLGLSRYTDSVEVVDNGATLDPSKYRLVDRGAAVVLVESNPSGFWAGPFVAITYTPNDADEVRATLYNLLALAGPTGTPETGLQSETTGSYSYTRGATGPAATLATKAALASVLLPKRNQAVTVYAVSRRIAPGDPVINLPEPAL